MKTAPQPRATLLEFFSELESKPGTFLVHDDGFRLTRRSFHDVVRAARCCARRFREAGIQPGDKILIYSENRPEWIAALWACLLAGAAAVPVDYRSSADFVARVQAITGARLILAGEETRNIRIDGAATWLLTDFEWPSESVPFDPHPAASSDLIQILFTSGATGEPKGVTITHRNILANLEPIEREIRKYLVYGKPFHPIRFLNLLPLSHLFGQSMAAFIPPLIAGEVFFRSGFDPREIARLVRAQRISVVVCVPRILDLLREYAVGRFPESKQQLPAGTGWPRRWWHYRRVHREFGWKFWAFITGAAPLDPHLEEFWRGLGYVVIQGYGLTETAPIVTLNHPFHTRKGSVGKPIAGVEVKLAPDGEILVKGENVTHGYFGAAGEGRALEDGWLHTGDIGEMDEEGRLRILGRKKEMIVTPEGMNVFPEDVEAALHRQPGVLEAAVVGKREGAAERIHAVLILEAGADAEAVVRGANQSLEDHQRIRGFSVWPGLELPRTEGTRKLKRAEIRKWVEGAAPAAGARGSGLEELLARYAHGRALTPETTLEELGLSSLDRVELLTELEQRSERPLSEDQFQAARTVGDLAALAAARAGTGAKPPAASPADDFDFPRWNRSGWAGFLRRISLPTWILPLGRIFARVRVSGLENLAPLTGPVIFAANHQSHFDVPMILDALPARWRYRTSPAMAKEFFTEWFHPQGFTLGQRLRTGLMYYLSALFFHAFPLPQREAGARMTLRYAGELASEGISILIFPEGKRTETGEINPFQPGVGLMASRLGLPVVPVRVEGLDRVLHKTAKWPTRGKATIRFGAPLLLSGDDYAALARQVERAVRDLGNGA